MVPAYHCDADHPWYFARMAADVSRRDACHAAAAALAEPLCSGLEAVLSEATSDLERAVGANRLSPSPH